MMKGASFCCRCTGTRAYGHLTERQEMSGSRDACPLLLASKYTHTQTKKRECTHDRWKQMSKEGSAGKKEGGRGYDGRGRRMV